MTDLPTGWEWARLNEIAEVRLGRQRSPKNHSGTHMRPYLRAANVGWEGLKLDDVKSMNFTDDEFEIYKLQPGDIVVAEASGSASEVGKPALWRGEIAGCCLQNTLIRVRSHGIDPNYLLHYLRAEARRGAFVEKSRGVGIHHIGAAKLSEWPAPIPPLGEQRRIVATLEDHLSRLDAGMSALRTALARAHILREQVIAAGCTGYLSSLDEGNAPAPSDVGLQDHPLPSIPGRWTWVRLHEVADVVGGITKDAKKQGDPSYEEVPYLRVANVQRGHLDLSNITTIRASREKIQQLSLENGDVLLNEGGDRDKLARGWIWEGQIDNCIHQNHVFRARIRDDTLHPKLLAWHANTFGKRWAEANGKQSVNLASISLSKIKLLPVPIPPRDDQQRIVAAIDEQLTAADRQADAARQSLRRAEVLRRALLAEAFGGRLVGQDPRDEPASVLLGRIRAERPARPKVTRGRRSRAAEPGQGSLL